jgi:hypothetical protein
MTYAIHSADFRRHIARSRRTADATAAPHRGLLTRIFNAIFESRERRTDREAEIYLARTGHRFTDSIERELNDRLFNGGWNARR